MGIFRINTAAQQLGRWLSRVYPPSSPNYVQPSEMDDVVRLFQAALPPSLVYDRMVLIQGTTVNPATQLFLSAPVPEQGTGSFGFQISDVGVKEGFFIYCMGCRWEQSTALSAGNGRAFIGVKRAGQAIEVMHAQSLFTAASFLDQCNTHSMDTLSPNSTLIGGGTGRNFVVPAGCNIHFSTAQVPGATTTYTASALVGLFQVGELHPD